MKEIASLGLEEQFFRAYNDVAKNVFTNGGKFTDIFTHPNDTFREFFVEKARAYNFHSVSNNIEWLYKMGELTSLCTIYVTKDDGSYDSCLCTVNIDVINAMIRKNMIVEGNVDRAIKSLSDGKRIAKAGKNNEIFAIRFDLVESGTVPKYKIVVPTKTFTTDKCIILPLLCHYIVEGGVMGYANKTVLKITSENGGIKRDRMMTTNAALLKKVYQNDAVVQSKMRYGNIGFNICDLRIHGYDLQATAENVRTTSFSLYTFVDASIPKKIDVSLANQNDDFIRVYFKRCVEKAIRTNKQSLLMQLMGDLGITFTDITGTDGSLKLAVIITKINHYGAYDLFTIMRKHPAIFGDTAQIKRGVKDIESGAITTNAIAEPRYLSTMNPEMAVSTFKDMLANGAVRVIYKTKGSGNISTLTLTNNFKILQRVYGDDYIARYESKGKMKSYAKKMLENVTTVAEVDSVLRLTGVDTLFTNYNAVDKSDFEHYKAEILGYIDRIEVRTPKRTPNPTEVRGHSLVAAPKMPNGEVSVDYYKTLDITRILECSYYNV